MPGTLLAETLAQETDFLSGVPFSSSVTLTIDPSSDRKPISPYLYGINIANWTPWYYLHMLEDRLWEARVEVVRLGATNMERYNFKNNRMYNVISMQNDYVPMSWESFVDWVSTALDAEPFLQASVYGNVASDAAGPEDPAYSHFQSSEEVTEWVASTGGSVRFWGIGNEPFIAWKRSDYPSAYSDAAHGDQVLNAHTAYDYYFNRFMTVAGAVKAANPLAAILGPTPANWWFYWFNDYSPICPVTTPGGNARPDDSAWQLMAEPSSTWDDEIFPDRGGNPDILGWESDPQKMLPSYLKQMYSHEESSGERLAEYLDVHRYIRCITERDAVQEPRGLFHETFESWDMETLFSGVRTNLLNRLNRAVDTYYPGTKLSFSEYGYFYWDGYPSISQVAAIGTMDYLGFFARGGVHVACNWYLGEPNQSGVDLTHAALDSSRQAMFDEEGNPNPKYWVFYMMSNLFRGTSISAEATDRDAFSVHACEDENGDYVVFAVNKGVYDPETGAYIQGQSPVRAVIRIMPIEDNSSDSPAFSVGEEDQGGPAGISASPLPVLTRLFRYGLDDPNVVEMDTLGIEPDSQGMISFEFHPLAIYAFVFSTKAVDSLPQDDGDLSLFGDMADGKIQVTPDTLNFGPYSNGRLIAGDETLLTHAVKITNSTNTPVPWSIDLSNVSWLNIEGSSDGDVSVTDAVYLTVDRSDLPVGTHEAELLVKTPELEKRVKVVVDVIPGEENGEKRIADFETGSLAHTLNLMPPYSVGWWDGHGAPNDRNSPYLYKFYLDRNELNRLGSRYCMGIDFDKSNGDNENGRRYQSFGTYGHATSVSFYEESSSADAAQNTAGSGNLESDYGTGSDMNSSSVAKYNATGFWEGYDAFEFDIKTDTEDARYTSLLIILSDEIGNKGKPAFDSENQSGVLKNHTDVLMIEDGTWQTVRIPLDGRFFDWRYPEGQNGAETAMDFSAITQIEFVPWDGDETRKGVIYIDNLRLTGPDTTGNRLPVAAVEKTTLWVKPGDPVILDGSRSHDPDYDGSVVSWQWIPWDYQTEESISVLPGNELSDSRIEYLSDSFSSAPVFSSLHEGVYIYDLVVTDDQGAQSRNMAQVMIAVSQDGNPGSDGSDDGTVSTGGGSSGEGCFCRTVMALEDGDEVPVLFSWSLLLILLSLVFFFLILRY